MGSENGSREKEGGGKKEGEEMVEKERQSQRRVEGKIQSGVPGFILFPNLMPGEWAQRSHFPNPNSSHPSLTFQGSFYCKYSSRRKINRQEKTALYSTQSQIENTGWERKADDQWIKHGDKPRTRNSW